MKTTVLCVLAAGVVASAPGLAAAAESYAVVSLVGDSVTIVGYRAATGSHFDQNTHEQVALGDGVFDRLATRVAANTIHRTVPDAAIQIIDVPDRVRFADPPDWTAPDGPLPSLLSSVRPLLKRPDTHYLVVVGKFRGDARLRVANGTLGSGKLTGLGFYLDPFRHLRNSAGETGRGFVAPFAYVQVTLVDLRTGAVVRSTSDEETVTRANAGPDASLDPWDALTSAQKVRILQNELGRAVQKTVPRVVAPT
jgi:hypothetical protein